MSTEETLRKTLLLINIIGENVEQLKDQVNELLLDSELTMGVSTLVECYALPIIKRFEGFRSEPYKCPAGVWTIGYGTTEGVTKDSKPITVEEAESLLQTDLNHRFYKVKNLVKVPAHAKMLAALLSFVYNVGIKAFRTSTLLSKLNKQDYEGAANEFDRWVYASEQRLEGLVKRRKAEKALFLDGYSSMKEDL